MVPLLAMARAHAATGDPAEFRLLYSVRTPDDVFYRRELAEAAASSPLEVDFVYTRRAPSGSDVPPGRLTRERLEQAVVPAARRPRIFVCGPTAFVEQVAVWLQEIGHAAADIRTERVGGS